MFFSSRSLKHVAVIGAGPSGLAALRHLSTKPELYVVKAFEKSSILGGMWNYSDTSGTDQNGLPIHSSVYKNMRVNGPTDLIQYTDFEFAKDVPALCSHRDVRQYIEEYANHYELKKFIKFNSIVTEIKPYQKTENEVIWEVRVNDVGKPEERGEMERFDAVIVAAGVFSAPYVPEIPGLNEFKGKVIHSFDYRTPEEFSDMRVMVLGGVISGQDISVDVSQCAREVIFSKNGHALAWKLPKNIRQSIGIERLSRNGAIMKDGTEYEIDALILCTGYKKHVPFLAPECRVQIEQDRISPLFKHVIHTEFPSLAFIGYTQIDTPFPNSELQLKFLMAAWEGKFKLPSTDEMNADIQRDLEIRKSLGFPANQTHHLAFLMRSYHHDLARLGGFEPLPRHHYDVFDVILEILYTGLPYRDYDFKRDETGEIDLERFKEYFVAEQHKSVCGFEEIQRQLNEIKRPRA